MKDSIRCCISCILPCGALDVVRIVHASGRVEEIGGGRMVLAGEIMRAYPRHVLRKPPSSLGDGPRAVVLPPDAELHRGSMYFLVPVASASKERPSSSAGRRRKTKAAAMARIVKTEEEQQQVLDRSSGNHSPTPVAEEEDQTRLLMPTDTYLSEKVSTRRDRRRGRVGVWRPRLESISETTNDW